MIDKWRRKGHEMKMARPGFRVSRSADSTGLTAAADEARQAGWIDVTTRNMRAEYAVGWKKFLIWSLIITLSFCWTSVNSCNVCAKCCCCWCGFQGALAAILVNAIISDQIRFYQNSNIDFHFFASPKTMLSEQQRNLCDDINRILVSFVWLFQRGSKYIIKHPWYFNFRR